MSELKTEPLPYTAEAAAHGGGEAGVMMVAGGGYEPGGYGGYHGGYEDTRHGAVQWPGAGAGYHHHAGAAHSQGSPTQRYPYYDSRCGLHPALLNQTSSVTTLS